MGFFKKIFKPVSKVLDKIIPNEIKPALPFAAAFAPFIAPGIMGSSVLTRAAMGGGLNILGQLSQEGNEGDINLLSAGLGALTGAMTAPGATVGEKVISPGGSDIFKVPGKNEFVDLAVDFSIGAGDTPGQEGDGCLSGTLDANIDSGGAQNEINFGTNTVLGQTSGPDAIVVRITAHKNWTGYISQIDFRWSVP